MKLYHRIVDYLFAKREQERKFSDLLTFVTSIYVLSLIKFPDHWNILMIFITLLVTAFILYHLVDPIFRFLLGKRNVRVGVGSFMLAAAVIATVQTFVN